MSCRSMKKELELILLGEGKYKRDRPHFWRGGLSLFIFHREV